MVVAAYAEQTAESTAVKDAPEAAGDDGREAQGGDGASSRAIGARVSPTDVVSALSPELRFNCVAMVCAIYSPCVNLHRKLRLQERRMGRLPRVLERSEVPAEASATPSDAATSGNTGVLRWIKQRWSAMGDEGESDLEHEVHDDGTWHLEHVKLLCGFMRTEQGREVTLRSILNSQGSSSRVFADYILGASLLAPDCDMEEITKIEPECGLPDSSDDDREEGVDEGAQVAAEGGDEPEEPKGGTVDDERVAPNAAVAAASSDGEEANRRERALSICAPCLPGVEHSPWTACWLVLAASVGVPPTLANEACSRIAPPSHPPLL
jgi:hypothetical protein